MKNLKVYLNDKRKYKLQRNAIGLFITGLTTLMLSGCVKDTKFTTNTASYVISSNTSNNSTVSDNNIDNSNNSSSSSISVSTSKVTYSDMNEAILANSVSFSDVDYYSLDLMLDEVKNDYKYSDYYCISKALNRYENISYDVSSSNVIINGKVDYDKLYNKVLINNKNFLSTTINKSYSEVSNLEEVCKYICEGINNELGSSYINIGELDQKLSDLKVLDYAGFTNAYYNQVNGMVVVNSKAIATRDASFFKKVIIHESKHIIQANSIEEKVNYEYEYRFGTSTVYDDLEVNSLKWDWFYEACADSLTLKNGEFNLDGMSYKNGVKSLYALKMATLDGNDELEKLSFTSNLDDIFNYFECETEEDKEEIVKMFFAYNIIHDSSIKGSSNEFLKFYKSINGESISITSYAHELEGNIAITESKVFYKKLAKVLMNNENVSINDLFNVISSFENELSCETWYGSRSNELSNFYENYQYIQSSFFELIANKIGVKESDVQDAYNKFNLNEVNHLNNSCFGKGFEEFLNSETERISINKRASIYSYYEKLKSANYK